MIERRRPPGPHVVRVDRRRGARGQAASPTYETFAFGTPSLLDGYDGGVKYTLGTQFAISQSLRCAGVEWYVPATHPAAAVPFTLWNADTQTVVATKSVSISNADQSTLKRVLFTSPTAPLSTSVNWAVSVFTDRYTASPGYTWPQTNGHLTTDALNGRLHAAGVETFPEVVSGNASNYHVSPVMTA